MPSTTHKQSVTHKNYFPLSRTTHFICNNFEAACINKSNHINLYMGSRISFKCKLARRELLMFTAHWMVSFYLNIYSHEVCGWERVKLNVIILLRIMQKVSIWARHIKKSSRVIKIKWKLIDVEDFFVESRINFELGSLIGAARQLADVKRLSPARDQSMLINRAQRKVSTAN